LESYNQFIKDRQTVHRNSKCAGLNNLTKRRSIINRHSDSENSDYDCNFSDADENEDILEGATVNDVLESNNLFKENQPYVERPKYSKKEHINEKKILNHQSIQKRNISKK
jgi:hypothetical protein